VLIPETGATLSAAGALMSELTADQGRLLFTTSAKFDYDAVNALLADMEAQCRKFAQGPGAGALEVKIDFAVEARYPHQIWEIEVPVRFSRITGAAELGQLVQDFHAMHKTIFEISDPHSGVEFVTWRAHVSCRLRERGTGKLVVTSTGPSLTRRSVYFSETGWTDVPVARFELMDPTVELKGPAIVESSFTTVVIDPGTVAQRTPDGGLRVTV
jgi:N-methylhydantoinase A